MYKVVYQKVEQYRLTADIVLGDKIPLMDNKWIEMTNSKSVNQLDTLITEYRRQKEEAVKVGGFKYLYSVFNSLGICTSFNGRSFSSTHFNGPNQ